MNDAAQPAGDVPARDWSKTLDLDRTTQTKSFVDRMEDCMRQIAEAQADLKEVISEAKTTEGVTPNDVRAMKKIASLRLKDQRLAAAEQMAALKRIGRAVQFNMFDMDDE